MRIFPFKSLTMRIWSILTVIIIGVVVCISLVQLLVLGYLNETKEREILQVSHRLAINDLQRDQLTRSVERGKIHHVLIAKKGNLVEILQPVRDKALLGWMASFIQEDKPSYHQQFSERFKKRKFLFEISQLTDDLYLISYIPLEGDRHVLGVITGGLVVILFGFLIAKLIANNLAKPLQRLEEYTKRIAKKDWDYEVEIKSSDEIGRLAIAMNEMKRALRQADEEEKKFLQSISHDLKTPVMVIMSYAQAIIDGVYIESVDNMATTIKKEAERLERKIKQIIYLNSLDYVLDHEKETEEVYLDKLLPYLVNNFQLIDSNLEWKLDLEKKDAVVYGDGEKIRISLENIFDNQLRYAKKTVEVSLKEDGDFWLIQISNDGPPIEEKELEQIFHRFYKGENGNFGLGLAISKKIIEFYQGQICVENKEQKVVFSVLYPKSKPHLLPDREY